MILSDRIRIQKNYITDNAAGTVTSYEYNVSGMLVSAEVTNTSGEQVITENIYDGADIRTAKTVTKKAANGSVISSDTTKYLVSGDDLLCTYTENSGQRSITSENVFGIDGVIILTVRSNGRYVYTTDLRGSTTSILNDSGASECIYYYDVYGEPEAYKSGSLYNEIMFTGAIYDESTGLLYLSSRFYDSESGRFTSVDSYRGEINDPLSLNYYGYCEGNPATYTDESGNIPVIAYAALLGATVGGVSVAINIIASGKNYSWKTIALRIGAGAISGGANGALMASGGGFIKTIGVSFATSFGEELFKSKITRKTLTKKDWQDIGETASFSAIVDTVGGKLLNKGVLKGLEDNEIAHNRKILKNIKRAYKGSKKYKKLAKGKDPLKNIKIVKFKKFKNCNKKWYKKVSKNYRLKLNLNVKKTSIKNTMGSLIKSIPKLKFNFKFSFKPVKIKHVKKSPIWRSGSGIW